MKLPSFRAGFLSSGSKGNCFYLKCGEDSLLLDAGISCREIFNRASAIGLDLSGVKALLITHEHSDHIRGAEVLSRKLKIPVYATEGTAAYMSDAGGDYFGFEKFKAGKDFEIGKIKIKSLPVWHDAADPTAYSFESEHGSTAVVTDLGEPSLGLLNDLPDMRLFFLESNHDLLMLARGGYPPHLKARIRSRFGHLSNEQAAKFALLAMQKRGVQIERLVLSHLSEQNNAPQKALQPVKNILLPHSERVKIDVAAQREPSRIYDESGKIVGGGKGTLPLD